MLKLRDYQEEGAKVVAECIKKHNLHYLAWGVRTGKSLTALRSVEILGCKKVLFVTKKKAMSSVQSDYNLFGFTYQMDLINKESIHKIEDRDYDLIISDEHHASCSSFPKPGKFARQLKEMFSDKKMLFLSGTPTPESFSQMYHQFWVSKYSPWSNYSNFYNWARDYVKVKQKRIGHNMHNDYSDGRESDIMADINHLISSRTQEQSGFTSKIDEHILKVKMKPFIHKMVKELEEHSIIEGKEEVILADTSVKLMQKIHQLNSGTIKFESGNSMTLDTTKAEFIKEHFKGLKMAIMYIFKQELELLREVFGEDNLTNDLEEFNSTDKHFVGQVVSSREGVNLSKADVLVMYNIQHSAVSYFQARDRLTTKDREENNVYWIFSEGGLEEKIYKVVQSKKKYTLNHFKKDYGIKR